MFSGLKFLGATLTLLPAEMRKDGVVYHSNSQQDLDTVRDWAVREAMVADEGQFITEETVDAVSKVFAPDDGLSIGVHVTHSANPDEYMYLEYPVVPMNTLVNKGMEVEVVYWAMESDLRRSGIHSDHRGVRFGFRIQNSWVEFVSISWGKIVAQKFDNLMDELSTTYPIVLLGEDGHSESEKEITVEGDVKAEFIKSGVAHDVQFTVNSIPYWER